MDHVAARAMSAHWAVKAMGAPKPPAPAPPSVCWNAKQQTCPEEQCCELEQESEDPLHEPAAVQLSAGAPPVKAPKPPGPGGPASAETIGAA